MNEPGEVVVKVRHDGPYKVTGPITLTDHEGLEFVVEGESIALCRCGSSATKPLCDGSHRRTGFDGTCTAPTRA